MKIDLENLSSDEHNTLAEAIVFRAKMNNCEYIRLNESGDIDEKNISLAIAIVHYANQNNIKVYGYTRLKKYSDALNSVGAVFRTSGIDTTVISTTDKNNGKTAPNGFVVLADEGTMLGFEMGLSSTLRVR
jgi:hypothetical protein